MAKEILLLYKGKLLASGDYTTIRNLIYDHPHEVKIVTNDSRKLAKNLLDISSVQNVNFKQEQNKEIVLIKTTQPTEFYLQLPKVISQNKIAITSISSTDDSLEAVFKYLLSN